MRDEMEMALNSGVQRMFEDFSLSDAPDNSKPVITGPQHPVPDKVDDDLLNILSWPRPHATVAEIRFCSWLNGKLREITGKPPKLLSEGCLYVSVPGPKGESTTLFSSHVDTVDAPEYGQIAPDLVRKDLTYDPNFGFIALDDKSKGSCLGADDGAGVWLMLKMLEAKVPGGYIFHRGEERGGIGSRAVLAKDARVLEKYELAVAFDRAGYGDIVTHQGGMECASDKLGLALAEKLNTVKGMSYKLSRLGTFTDTKVYRGVIAECLNISVGYTSQHGRSEDLDYSHLNALKDALIKLAWDALPIDRDPRKPDPAYNSGGYRGSKSFNSSWMGNGHVSVPYFGKKKKPKVPKVLEAYEFTSAYDQLVGTHYGDIQAWVEVEPDEGAKTIVDLLIEVGRLRSDAKILAQLAGLEGDEGAEGDEE